MLIAHRVALDPNNVQATYQLGLADLRAGVRYIIKRNEMDAFMIERVMRLAEKFLERGAVVERGIVLSWHEAYRFYLERSDDIAKFGHALAALLRVIRGVGMRCPCPH